ncbi:hypothetical protein BCR32DRAFT_267235 [Anaeromyces robustus]|uniref:Uncharacterized protein n=1 Tax=Anaeromyces robustus TaxID=1754192 RepID=A0A1Y1XBG3_9FUNG|nr:hypothetical protein BCR32DRAFT_267235 [Anaeromyces robustus]|eukprot:ORX83072.1 hypothetical protein BCR32DRAFT_267235 [Anaeromyces robustus]
MSETDIYKVRLYSDHKTVQIQVIEKIKKTLSTSLNENEITNLNNLLWECIKNNNSSIPIAKRVFICSLSANALVELVKYGKNIWIDVLNNFYNIIPGIEEEKLPIIVDVIIKLLKLHVENVSTKMEVKDYNTPFELKSLNIHPLIFLIQKRSETWPDIVSYLYNLLPCTEELLEINNYYKNDYLLITLEMLSPFIKYTILNFDDDQCLKNSFMIKDWLIQLLNNTFKLESKDKKIQQLKENIVHLIYFLLIHLTPNSNRINTIHQCFTTELTNLIIKFDCQKEFMGDFIYNLLACILEQRKNNISTHVLTKQIYLIVKEKSSNLTIEYKVIFPEICLLLLDVIDIDEEKCLVSIMEIIINQAIQKHTPLVKYLPLAIFPLLQVYSETTANKTKSKALNLIKTIELNVLIANFDKSLALENEYLTSNEFDSTKIFDIIYPFQNTNIFSTFVWNIDIIYQAFRDNEFPKDVYFNFNDNYNVLYKFLFLFHKNEEIRSKALNSIIIKNENKSLVFGIIYLYLYYLKLEVVPELQMEIILDKLPSLTELDDIFITNKIVKIITLYYNHKNSDSKIRMSYLSCVGLRALFEIWKRQPKIWNQLKYNISNYINERCIIDCEPDEGLNEFDIAYISILHDICDHRIKECGQESIAWIKSLLGIKNLNQTCKCLLLDTLNKCIENDIINARAAWILIINEFVNSLKENTHHLVYKYLFQYYNLIAKKAEDTEIYYEFKSLILSNYILPLLSSENVIIRSYVMDTLSLYPVNEIIEQLPSPNDIIKFTEKNSYDEIIKLYHIIINNEITNMKSYKNAKNNKIDNSRMKSVDTLKQYGRSICEEWYNGWKNGTILEGKKSGIMHGILHSISNNIIKVDSTKKITKDNNIEFIHLVNISLEEIDLSDSMTSRLGLISSWCSFFEQQFINIESSGETKSELFNYCKELFNEKMRNSAIPSLCANSFMAYTGLVIAYYRTNNSSYQYINELIDNLLQYSNLDSYIRHEFNNNDDIRFAIIISLTYLYNYIHATDERRKKNIFNQFNYLIHDSSLDKNSWHAFSLTYGLGHILNILIQSLSNESQDTNKSLQKNDHVNILNEYIDSLINGFENLEQRETLEFFGRKLGFLKLLELEDDTILPRETLLKILNHCYKEIELLLSGNTILKYIEGDFWILAYASLFENNNEEEEDDGDDEKEERKENNNNSTTTQNNKYINNDLINKIEPIFNQALNYIRTNNSQDSLYIHLFASYCYRKFLKFSKKLKEESDDSLLETISYRSQVLSLVQLFTEENIANNTKISSIFGTMASLGINIIDLDNDSDIIIQEYPDMVKDILEKLKSIYKDAMGKILKDARLSYILQGRILRMIHLLNMIKKLPSEDQQQQNLKLKKEGNSEAKDYSRLPLKTSYLRAIFNTLNKLSKETELNETQYTIIKILLKSLISIDNSLPSVNWNPLLSQLTLMNINSNELKILCLEFALKHVYLNHKLSKSILFYLLNSITFLFSENNIQHHKDLLVWFISEKGLGNQLILAGLPPFDQIESNTFVNVNDVVISYTKMAEIIQTLINCIYICENSQKYLDNLVEVLSRHLLSIPLMENITANSNIEKVKYEILNILRKVYESISLLDDVKNMKIIRLMFSCFVCDPEFLIELMNSTTDRESLGKFENNNINEDLSLQKLNIGISQLVDMECDTQYAKPIKDNIRKSIKYSKEEVTKKALIEVFHIMEKKKIENDIKRDVFLMNVSCIFQNIQNLLSIKHKRLIQLDKLQWLQEILDLSILYRNEEDSTFYLRKIIFGIMNFLWMNSPVMEDKYLEEEEEEGKEGKENNNDNCNLNNKGQNKEDEKVEEKDKDKEEKELFENIMNIYSTLKEINNNLVVQLNGFDFLFGPEINKEKQEAICKRLLSIMKHFSNSDDDISDECYYEIKFGLIRFHNKCNFIKSHLIELSQD